MDFLQWKKRAIISEKYNFLLIEATGDYDLTLSVASVVCNGIPFICLIGAEAAVEAAFSASSSEMIECAIQGILTAETAVEVLQGLLISVSIDPMFSVNAVAVVADAKSTGSVMNALGSLNISTILGSAKVLSSVLAGELIASCNASAGDLLPVIVEIVMSLVVSSTATVGTAAAFSPSVEGIAAVSFDASTGSAQEIVGSGNYIFQMSSGVIVALPKIISVNIAGALASSVDISVARESMLSNLDSLSLATMDSETLASLNYYIN